MISNHFHWTCPRAHTRIPSVFLCNHAPQAPTSERDMLWALRVAIAPISPQSTPPSYLTEVLPSDSLGGSNRDPKGKRYQERWRAEYELSMESSHALWLQLVQQSIDHIAAYKWQKLHISMTEGCSITRGERDLRVVAKHSPSRDSIDRTEVVKLIAIPSVWETMERL